MFRDIVKEQTELKKYPTPSFNELVIQVRLGDIMNTVDYDLSRKKSEIFYSNFFNYIDLNLSCIKHITVVTALHFGSNEINGKYFYTEEAEARSYKIIENLKSQCFDKGYDLKIYSHEDIDKDICYLAGSKFFVKGITPLSDLITKCLPAEAVIMEPFSYFG